MIPTSRQEKSLKTYCAPSGPSTHRIHPIENNAGIVLVGVGQWGKNLARNFSTLGILKGVCDCQPEMLKKLVMEYPKSKIYAWEEALKDPDVHGIALAVPANQHFSMACQALQAGKDVFIEKPVVFRLEEIETLRRLAASQARIVMGGHLLRYHPVFQEIERWVDNKKLGDLLFIHAQRENFGRVVLEERNTLWSLGCHDLSLILALTKTLPQSFESQHCGIYTPKDYANILFHFPQNVKAQLVCSWTSPVKQQRFWVRGTEGALVWENTTSASLTFYPQKLSPKGLEKQDPVNIPFDLEEPLLRECRHFWSCIQSRTLPSTNLDEVQRVTQVLVQIENESNGIEEEATFHDLCASKAHDSSEMKRYFH